MTTTKRAILEGGAAYEVDESARIGDMVRAEYGSFGKVIEQRIMGFQSPDTLEWCVCGAQVVRLGDGTVKPAYFGACKRAVIVR